jgi:F0F1-type ATP synthase assembly protein I
VGLDSSLSADSYVHDADLALKIGAFSLDQQPNQTKPPTPGEQKVKKYATNTALAFELPFTIVGAVLLGGLLGYFLDHWLHTKIVFTLILGGVGFFAGLKEVLRRLG